MAHWVIDDRGFGGQYYRCSECGESWCDIYYDISMEENCPNCRALINIDENEYIEKETSMKNNLYFIANMGCDATTRGLIEISNEDFPKFKSFIENLNKNSYYGCMPTISVYKISMDDLKEINYNPNAEYGDDDYIEKEEVFYLDGKTYTFSEKYFLYYDLECVIKGG